MQPAGKPWPKPSLKSIGVPATITRSACFVADDLLRDLEGVASDVVFNHATTRTIIVEPACHTPRTRVRTGSSIEDLLAGLGVDQLRRRGTAGARRSGGQ